MRMVVTVAAWRVRAAGRTATRVVEPVAHSEAMVAMVEMVVRVWERAALEVMVSLMHDAPLGGWMRARNK
jgi:hypothetical protein